MTEESQVTPPAEETATPPATPPAAEPETPPATPPAEPETPPSAPVAPATPPATPEASSTHGLTDESHLIGRIEAHLKAFGAWGEKELNHLLAWAATEKAKL